MMTSPPRTETRPIRVLQFADLVNRHDFIDNIVQHANAARFEVGMCTRQAESTIETPVYGSGTPHWVIGAAARRATLWAAWKLARILRDWRADIVHTHHYDQAVIGWLATRMHRRTRLVVGRHYSDAIYRSPARWKRRILLALEGRVNRAAARIVVPSTLIREMLIERQKVDAVKVAMIPYGFEPAKYAVPTEDDIGRLRAELGLVGRFVFGTFARLHEEKGHRFLLEAIAMLRQRYPDLLFLFVGEGGERTALEAQIQRLNLHEAVRLVGWRRDAMTILAAVDAVVQPTLQEAFSQVMAEALWMSKPLIMTDVSGTRDVVTDGVNGLVVPKADAAALAQAIEHIRTNEALRRRLAEAGRAHVETHLQMKNIIGQYEEVYARVMEEPADVAS